MKPGIPFVLGLVLVGCSASSADAPDDPVSVVDAGGPSRDASTPAQDASAPRDSGFDAGAPDTYVPPVVQDSGNIPFPDAAPAVDSGGFPFPTGDGGNPLCATFPPQCCTAITDPACLNVQVILLQQFCCTP